MNNFKSPAELTLRGLLLGTIFALLFTATNVYIGLKIGYTFTTSVPVAVISMATLRRFSNTTILESSMVQTITAAASTLAAMVFILPALIIIGAWQHFPFWQTFFLTATGGIFGVIFILPLRQALVVQSPLPFPEGTAAAEILKEGSLNAPGKHQITLGQKPVRTLVISTLLAWFFTLFSNGFKLLGQQLVFYGKIAGLATGWGLSLGPALIGAGYLIGIHVAIALLIGAIISWGITTPLLSLSMLHSPLIYHEALTIWLTKVRFIGIGTISIAIFSAFHLLMRAFIRSLHEASANRLRPFQQYYNMPRYFVIILSLLLTGVLAILFGQFIHHNMELSIGVLYFIVGLCLLFLVLLGITTANISAYMAGLVGASSSPVSSIGLIILFIISLLLTFTFHNLFHSLPAFFHYRRTIAALAILVTSAIFAIVAVSNDAMQDLRTGYLVGTTPWKQHVALIIGVILGSLTIAPVLNVLYHAYGFTGSINRAIDTHYSLNIPQATLMVTLAKGIVGDYLNWGMVLIGMVLGLILILIDRLLLKRKQWPRLSVLSVGIGIYIPVGLVSALVIGGILSWLIKRKVEQFPPQQQFFAKRSGILFACGLMIGEALLGILLAVLITTTNKPDPLAIVSTHFQKWSYLLGTAAFILLCYYFYYNVTRKNRFHKTE